MTTDGNPVRSWSSSRLQSLPLLAAVLALELLPLQAWLMMLAGYGSGNLTRTSAPLWLVVGSVLSAWALQRIAGQRRAGQLMWVWAAWLLIELLVLLRVSPDEYGSVPGSPLDLTWLSDLGNDLVNGSPHIGAAILLLLLLVYLSWRGIRLGRDRLEHGDVLSRLRNGMGVLIVAVVTAALVPDRAQQSIIGMLAVFLPLEVFAGLMAAALTRAAAQRARERRDGPAASGKYPWLRTSVVLSALVIALALAVSLVVNYQSVGALLGYLGPVGNAIDTAIGWVIDLLAQVLFFLFDGLLTALRRQSSNAKPPVQQPPRPPCVPSPKVHCSPQFAPLPPFWQHLAVLLFQGLVLALVVTIFVFVLRLSFAAAGRRAERTADEEREALDGRGLFAAQLRSLFARRSRTAGEEPDQLARESVRYVYREVLRAAARLGLQRAQAETPDEYAERLGQTAPIATGGRGEDADLRALSEAYDAARYAGREPDRQQREPLWQGAERILQRLRPRRT